MEGNVLECWKCRTRFILLCVHHTFQSQRSSFSSLQADRTGQKDRHRRIYICIENALSLCAMQKRRYRSALVGLNRISEESDSQRKVDLAVLCGHFVGSIYCSPHLYTWNVNHRIFVRIGIIVISHCSAENFQNQASSKWFLSLDVVYSVDGSNFANPKYYLSK